MDGASFSNNEPTYPVCPVLFVAERRGRKDCSDKRCGGGERDQNVKVLLHSKVYLRCLTSESLVEVAVMLSFLLSSFLFKCAFLVYWFHFPKLAWQKVLLDKMLPLSILVNKSRNTPHCVLVAANVASRYNQRGVSIETQNSSVNISDYR